MDVVEIMDLIADALKEKMLEVSFVSGRELWAVSPQNQAHIIKVSISGGREPNE